MVISVQIFQVVSLAAVSSYRWEILDNQINTVSEVCMAPAQACMVMQTVRYLMLAAQTIYQ